MVVQEIPASWREEEGRLPTGPPGTAGTSPTCPGSSCLQPARFPSLSRRNSRCPALGLKPALTRLC